MTAVTTIYRSKIHSSFRRRKCNIPSSSVISRRNAVSAQIYTTREKRRLALPGGPEPAAGPPSSRRGLGAHRSRCPPGPRSARGQFLSPFLLKRDSNQTTPSAEEGEATPWTGHTPTPWRPRGRPAACPHGPRALREDLPGGGGPQVCPKPPRGHESRPSCVAAKAKVYGGLCLHCYGRAARGVPPTARPELVGATGALRSHRLGRGCASSGWSAGPPGGAAPAPERGPTVPREAGGT